MMSKINILGYTVSFESYLSKKLCILFFIVVCMIQLSCVKSSKSVIMLDMSKEHDGLRFLPEKGDQVGIVLNIDQKVRSTIILTDEDKDWIYTAAIRDVIKQGNVHSDTLVFKFYCVSGDGRNLPNNGEETIPNRKISVPDLYNKKLLFIFNENYEDLKKAYVTFVVGTSCQKVLGFFKPEEGDQIVVTGSFCGWDERGILMENKDKADIYKVELPVKYQPEKPIEYKFRMINFRNAVLPQSGWENRENRILFIQNENEETPYAEFNDVRRVARFIINTTDRERNGSFSENKGDILQIKLILDGNESLSDPLMRVKQHRYETAVIIPLTVQKNKMANC